MLDTLGDRMKSYYEDRFRYYLPRNTYTIIRCDGCHFHNYTKNLNKPYDIGLMHDMNLTAKYLCENIQNVKMAFVQSDEISLLLTDFDNIKTEAWFNGNIQKMASVSASLATAKLNSLRTESLATFDSRCFILPNIEEVKNYFIWRQKDCIRNSISMTAQSKFSHKILDGKSSGDKLFMLKEHHNIDYFNDYPKGFIRGRCVVKEKIIMSAEYINKNGENISVEGVERNIWNIYDALDFMENKEFLNQNINL